jgi:hypothetical protein
MDTPALSKLLAELNPAELRQRIADIDRERSALAVLLRAATARQLGLERQAKNQDGQRGTQTA